MQRQGFTMVEMLLVMGIVAILALASTVAYDKVRATAERARCSELVSQVETAMTALFETEGHWPKAIREGQNEDGDFKNLITEKVAGQLAGRNLISLTHNRYVTTGADRFGILTPWARDVVKRMGRNARLDSVVSSTRQGKITVKDNLLHYAVDLDGDGIVNNVRVCDGDKPLNIRGTVAIWSIGKSGGKAGKPWPYKEGCRRDDIYSWSVGHVREIEGKK